MIWAKVATGRFYSNTDGTERKQPLDVMDWGLDVKDVLYGAVLRGRSSTNAKVKIGQDEGATADVNAMTAATDPIAFTTVNFALPRTVKGSVSPSTLPFFRPVVSVAAVTGWHRGIRRPGSVCRRQTVLIAGSRHVLWVQQLRREWV